jgi:NADPH-dependent 2,4-dienoyl-CoA reductase/sulfur reductase-like enzyme
MTDIQVAIVGAGPYGLAASAYVRRLGLSTAVIGEPMWFWQRRMPAGMFLRSPNVASDIADPERRLSLAAYGAASGKAIPSPVPIERFIDYGLWVQQQVAPAVDLRRVERIEGHYGGFRLTFAGGERTTAAQVVVAAGIAPFAARPQQFDQLPPELATHSSDHADLSSFAGQRIAVVGGGQSALESAALLREAGCEVEVLARNPRVFFLRRQPWLHQLGPLTRLMFAPAEVGPAGLSRLVEQPGWYRRLPRVLQDRIAVRSLRPAGAAWLIPRLRDVPITSGAAVTAASRNDGYARLTLDDGTERCVDHVLLATGFRVDIGRYGFLGDDLLRAVRQVSGHPCLSRTFESSIPGLYFLGAPAAWSFGPLMRFVAGTGWAARALARGIERRARTSNV